MCGFARYCAVRSYGAKRDTAEPGIITALEAAGYTVVQLSQAGLPDLLVIRAGRYWMIEVKSRPTRITPAQKRFAALNVPCPFAIVRDESEALRAVGVVA